MKRPRSSRYPARIQLLKRASHVAVLLAGLSCVACSSAHSPPSADTATSWLRACVDSDDCAGVGSCVERVCTLPCSGTSASSCAELAPTASCQRPSNGQQGICDLVCASNAACTALGNGYTCQDARCRPPTIAQISSQALSVELVDVAPDDWMQDAPVVTWSGDHWRIAHTGRPRANDLVASSSTVVVSLSDLYPNGTIKSYGAPTTPELPAATSTMLPLSTFPMAIGPDGTIAIDRSERPPFGSPAEEVLFLLPEGDRRPTLQCPGYIQVEPLSSGGDWLILCADAGGDVSLGRYNPHDERWTVPARTVVTGLKEIVYGGGLTREGVFVSTQGNDALLVRDLGKEGAALARIAGGAAPGASSIAPPRSWQEVDAASLRPIDGVGYFGWGDAGGWLVPTWYEEKSFVSAGSSNYSIAVPLEFQQRPSAYQVRNDGSLGGALQFQLSTNAHAELHTVHGLPERDMVAFCHTEMGETDDNGQSITTLLFSLFDKAGRRVSGPTPLASSVDMIGLCQLTWSGSSFLATWLQSKYADWGATSPPVSNLRARILSIP